MKTSITYINMDFSNEKNYYKLEEMFEKLNISDEIMYYFAVSPDFFIPITKGLSTISKRLENAKIIVEKPFGKDLESAKKLNEEFKKYLKYENIYYIDHYLGKEMLLNIMTIRFFNSMFNGVWNKEFVDNVQITVSETVGVETRGNYYDKAGAIADMLQNHLLQILSVVAMDEPQNFTTQDIKEAQTDIFRKLRRISNDDIQDYMVLGQYDGYKDEDKVDKNSNTETYVAMKLFVDNDRYIYSHIIPYLKGEIEEFDDYQMDEWFSYHKNILNEVIILFAEAMEIGFLKHDPILINIKDLILKERRARYDHIWNR